MLNGAFLLPGTEFYVAVGNAGLWPNLTLMPDGEIVAAVYNRPSHGGGCGDVELWVSADRGRIWTKRSVVSDHSENPGYVRMNHAIGLNRQGDLIALVSGYHDKKQRTCLPIQVCITSDSGHTWKRHEINCKDIPFGDIVLGEDEILFGSASYEGKGGVYVYRSKDDGQTWGDRTLIMAEGNETALLRCRNGRWLAAVREGKWRTFPEDRSLFVSTDAPTYLLTSSDEARTWSGRRQMSFPGQHPAHLLELNDGTLILSCGSRIPGLFGVVLRYSTDGGKSWSEQRPLISISETADCGYPSSVQLEDGTIVTAYYFGPKLPHVSPLSHAPSWQHALPWHCRYHTGVARWHLECLTKQ